MTKDNFGVLQQNKTAFLFSIHFERLRNRLRANPKEFTLIALSVNKSLNKLEHYLALS